jgi:signal transduction histidine kinase/ligand-binding sensor domain-containing protein
MCDRRARLEESETARRRATPRAASSCARARTRSLARALLAGCALLLGLPRAAASSGAPPLDAAAPSYRVQVWTTSSGLPQGTINEICQTANGELWIATFGGLLRFDGMEFRAFDIDSLAGLPTNRITSMVEDGLDGLWLMTQDGELLRFRDGRITEMHRIDAHALETVDLAMDRAGILWARNSSGALQRFENGVWEKQSGPIGDAGYEELCAEMDGTVDSSSGRRLLRFDPSGKHFEERRAPARITSLAAARAGGVWIGLEDGLARASGGTLERVTLVPALGSAVLSIQSDETDGLWLGLTNGLAHATPSRTSADWSVTRLSGLPPGFEVRSLELDREGSLWVGSRGQGIARVTQNHLSNYPSPGASGASALASDGAGGAYCGFDCNALAHLAADGRMSLLSLERTSAGELPCIRAMCVDQGGRLLYGSQNQVTRVSDGAFEHPAVLQDRKDIVRALARSGDGSLWLGALSGLLQHLSADDRPLEAHTLPEPIQCLVQGSDDALWIGGTASVFRLHGADLQRFGPDVGMPGGGVRDIAVEHDGSAWIATYGGGMARLSNGRVTRITRAQGLPDSSLTRIQDDGLGRLWVSSNRGLIIAERSEWLAVAEGHRRTFDPVVLGPEAGMPEANFGSPAGFRGEDGRLWFGSIEGAVRVDPREFPFNRTAPKLRIERASADEQALALNDTVEVPAGTRRLVLNFAAFALVAPERVRFRCRLSGFDDAWHDNGGERSTTYTGLAPGDYTFEVLARNEDGVWSTEPTSVRIHVAPSWWQTSFARIAFALLFLAAILAILEFRLRVVARRARVLIDAAEERHRAEERASRLREELEHMARVATAGELATSLAHEVNQPLAAIVANAQAGRRFLSREGFDRRDLEEIFGDIAQQGQRASDVIRRLRDFLRKHVTERVLLDLNTVLRDALPLVRRELEDHRVEVVLDFAESLPHCSADPVQMQQVFVNLVKNACEAMSELDGERRIELRTRTDGALVRFEVQDNGPGLSADVRARLFQPFVTTKPDGMGLGLAICQSIVEAHGGSLRAESASGGGVVFVVELPSAAEEEANA